MINGLDWLRNFTVPGKQIPRSLVRRNRHLVLVAVATSICADCPVIIPGRSKRCAPCRAAHRKSYRADWARDYRAEHKDEFRQYRRNLAARKKAVA